MYPKLLIALLLIANFAQAESLHSDPTVAGNVAQALKYLGRLTEKELTNLEETPLEPSLTKLSMEMDAIIRRQGAPVPLRYPMPPFRDNTPRTKVIETNPNPDLFPKLDISKLSKELKSLITPLTKKTELSPAEVAGILSRFEKGEAQIEPKLVEELRDVLGIYAIRCYNTFIVKAGTCHGPSRPLPDGAHE